MPIDSHYFTYDAASDSYKITLRFWAGTYTSSVYDKLMPSANREDFTVTNLQLKLANGKSYLPDSIGPESYTYPDTGKVVNNKAKTNLSTALDAVHNIGDSTGMAPYLDAAFTIPAKDATAVGAVIDTTALTEGAHTLTVTDGVNTKNVSFLVDNTALGEMVVTLDGEPVSDDIDTNAVTLGAGTHTLAVYARDAAGNEAVKSADFVAGDDVAVILNAAVSDIGQNAASLNVTAEGNMQGAQATYYQLDALNSSEITSTTNDGILPYITYTLKVGEVSDSDSLVLSWNGRASNADATHASRLFVQNTATGAWDEAATADENGPRPGQRPRAGRHGHGHGAVHGRLRAAGFQRRDRPGPRSCLGRHDDSPKLRLCLCLGDRHPVLLRGVLPALPEHEQLDRGQQGQAEHPLCHPHRRYCR